MASRIESVKKNTIYTIFIQVIILVLGFISRSFFVRYLGKNDLGINGLYTQILSFLSFAELGIGQALLYSMYKPLAEKKWTLVDSLMELYRKVYFLIGFVVLILGLIISAFIPYMVNGIQISGRLYLIFYLFLINSVISYFLVYKRSLFIADQKSYILQLSDGVVKIFFTIFQVIGLYMFNSYELFMILTIISTIISNVIIHFQSHRFYPQMFNKNSSKLDSSQVNEIKNNVKSIVVYKIGNVVLSSTDNIIISIVINTIAVGIYSNYLLLINAVNSIISQVFGSIISSIGNLQVTSTVEKKEEVLYQLLFISAWLFGFISFGMFLFFNNFITLWLGSDYLLDITTVGVIALTFYINNMHYPAVSYRQAAGLFRYGQYVPVVSSVINLFLSIFLGKIWGLSGIFIATIIARCLTFEIIDPLNLYKYIFKKSMGIYFKKYIGFSLFSFLSGMISILMSKSFSGNGIGVFVIQILMYCVIYNITFLVVSIKTKEYTSLRKMIL